MAPPAIEAENVVPRRMLAQPLEFGGEFVDYLSVGVDSFGELGFLCAESLVFGFQVDHSCLDVLERRWDSVGLFALFFEFLAEVGVFVGEDPAFDAGFGGELEDGEGAGELVGWPASSRCMASRMASRSAVWPLALVMACSAGRGW